MDNIVVDRREGRKGLLVVARILLIIGWYIFWGSLGHLIALSLCGVYFSCIAALVFCVKSTVKSEIDLSGRIVLIHLRSLIGQERVQRYHLSEFLSVRTFFKGGRHTANDVVVLIAADGKTSLAFAEFIAPGEPGKRNLVEADEARVLREQIAVRCGLKDDGFSGNRWWQTRMVKASSAVG